MKKTTSLRRLALCAAAVGAVMSCNSDTSPDPNVPKFVTPAEGAVLDNGCVPNSDSIVWDFSWTAVPNATAYHLYVNNVSSVFATIDDSTLTGTSFHYSRLATYENLTTGWQWWVRAEVNGVFHDWAGPRAFAVEPVNTDCP
jgi:hypothetical protein